MMSRDKGNSERILCAAIHFDDYIKHERQPPNIDSGFVLCGWRHGNCFGSAQNYDTLQLKSMGQVQGFLTSRGRFVDRFDAWKIAEQQHQIVNEPAQEGILFSDDLY